MGRQYADLIAQYLSIDSIHWVRVTPFESGVALRMSHEEGTRPQYKLVQHVDLVSFSIGYVNEAGDIAPQVQRCVQLDGRLVREKRHPGKHRQAQVDGAGSEIPCDTAIELAHPD